MAERTPFESKVEDLVLDHTDNLFSAVMELAYRNAMSNGQARGAITRFGGGDLGDAFDDWMESRDQ